MSFRGGLKSLSFLFFFFFQKNIITGLDWLLIRIEKRERTRERKEKADWHFFFSLFLSPSTLLPFIHWKRNKKEWSSLQLSPIFACNIYRKKKKKKKTVHYKYNYFLFIVFRLSSNYRRIIDLVFALASSYSSTRYNKKI